MLEAFGVGNMPDLPSQGYLPWLKRCIKQGIKVRRPPPRWAPLRATGLAALLEHAWTAGSWGRMHAHVARSVPPE